jgi:2-oxo-4-hydroxy-4-carboxy-5-ureidoimidazoline decarboxylase
VDLQTFNELAPDAAADLLRPCADVDGWITDLLGGRPYADVDSVLTFAEAAAAGWGAVEVDSALAQHPRIGERHAGTGVEAAMSSAEQAAIQTDAGDDKAIAQGNRDYEQTFGRIFLIRAAGRTSAEVLDQLTEIAVVAGQLREIALLRLRGTFE